MELFLSCDVYSYRGGGLYGKSGTKVTVISDRHPVLIVEGPNGNRFPVHHSKTITHDQKEASGVVSKSGDAQDPPVHSKGTYRKAAGGKARNLPGASQAGLF